MEKNVHEIEIKLNNEWEKCLDDAFKKSCLRKMRSFLVCAGLTVTFAAVAVGGYLGNEREKKLNYENRKISYRRCYR